MATREQVAVQAHSRKVHAECDRLLRQIDSSREKMLREVQRFEEKLLDDPIRVGKMRYSEAEGFDAESFTVEAEAFSFTFNFLASSTKNEQANFDPGMFATETAKFDRSACSLRPLVRFSRYVLRISNCHTGSCSIG